MRFVKLFLDRAFEFLEPDHSHVGAVQKLLVPIFERVASQAGRAPLQNLDWARATGRQIVLEFRAARFTSTPTIGFIDWAEQLNE
jgi:hypothetical protein